MIRHYKRKITLMLLCVRHQESETYHLGETPGETEKERSHGNSCDVSNKPHLLILSAAPSDANVNAQSVFATGQSPGPSNERSKLR